MIATSPDKVVLRIMWDLVRTNNRSPVVQYREIAERVQQMQEQGFSIYPTRAPEAIVASMRNDARLLARMGLVQAAGEDAAELTGAGELVGASVQLPG